MQLDTGATVTIMTVKLFKKINPSKRTWNFKMLLRAIGVELIKPVAEVSVMVKHNGQSKVKTDKEAWTLFRSYIGNKYRICIV